MNRRVLWCFRGDNSDISRDFVVLAGRGPVTRGFPAGRRWGFGVPIPFNPNSEIGRGGTGGPPVSSGHCPDETATRAATQCAYNFVSGFHFPPHFYLKAMAVRLAGQM